MKYLSRPVRGQIFDHKPVYSVIPTPQPTTFGQVYAAYGDWFVALSILWAGS